MPKKPQVMVRVEKLTLPTYLPQPPDRNPMFLERRVYQGSCGKVYPLPFIDRIAGKKVAVHWKAIWLENAFLRVLVLPELGGRIHAIQDKTNGYDLIYNQAVIKPALVGLAGPWISGGIEFNWPQHHRPGTFLPVDFQIETHGDGSKTVWCSDHEPMGRMKGMHGVCLRPDRAFVELKVRVYNRTPLVQTFLWWANVATKVHESYQSFFPPDVNYVADHAKRATSAYPRCGGSYYGVDYADRGRRGISEQDWPTQFVPPHCRSHAQRNGSDAAGAPLPCYTPDDLSFYANIPTPCSYMCMGSKQDFFGGYDYSREAGLVHIADHHISPGKKQWTWGNHPFGYAWDRNLTDPDQDGVHWPYIELMAGVYTDNQPDFSFLQPGETKTWSQYWYPIQKIGPAQHANLDAAVSLACERGEIRAGVSVSRRFPRARIRFERDGSLREWRADLAPGKPFYKRFRLPFGESNITESALRVLCRKGEELICYRPERAPRSDVPPPASEPPSPGEVQSVDELYLIGVHLEQYRHASRCPTLYWREGLRRDPGDCRCNNAIGLWHMRRGEFGPAEVHFGKAIARLTQRNPNPADSEAFYNQGLCLRHQGRDEEAYASFYKATWNEAWQAAGYLALAEIDCKKDNWEKALEHLDHSLCYNCENTRARNLKGVVLEEVGRHAEARELVKATLKLDPLDWWARYLAHQPLTCDLQTALDIAHDYARAGFYAEASALLQKAQSICRETQGRNRSTTATAASSLPNQNLGAEPLVQYTLGWLCSKLDQSRRALAHFKKAARSSPDYCFPSRLEEIEIFETAIRANANDARAPYYLGNLLYDRRRHEEAIALWEKSAHLCPHYSVVWRNLGLGYLNVRKQPARARAAYERAFRALPTDARLLYERDQLWKRLGEQPRKRLRELERHLDLVAQRDDLSVELCALYNQTGRPQEASELLRTRQFQPWEGGEGQALGQYVRSELALGKAALALAEAQLAYAHFQRALATPGNLGEARHLLANQSDVHYWLGLAGDKLDKKDEAKSNWRAAAQFKGDFQEMRVRSFSEMTYYSALAWRRLGNKKLAHSLLKQLLRFSRQLATRPATMDYFATSLPAMLLFDDDLDARQKTTALLLEAQARLGLGELRAAGKLFRHVLQRDPNHAMAADFLSELQGRISTATSVAPTSKSPMSKSAATRRLVPGDSRAKPTAL